MNVDSIDVEEGTYMIDSDQLVQKPSEINRNKPSRKGVNAKITSVAPVQSSFCAVEVVTYHGLTINSAAQQSNLPVCVLLWGMAAAKSLSLMVPDSNGNNPMHFAALADSPEVMGFFHQQMQGKLNENLSLVDARNNRGETPLLRAAYAGNISVMKVICESLCD